MRIFFVARGWPSEREPQWGCFERDQALALSELGHQVVVLSVDARFRRYHRKYGISREENEGIPHYDLFAGAVWGKALREISVSLHVKVRQFFFMHLFKAVIEREGVPDVVYGHYLGGASMALAVKKKYNIPVVGIEHWSELGYDNIKKNVKKWASMVYKDLDLLLTVSSALQKNIKRNFGIDSVVVNNMVGKDFYYVQQIKDDKKVRFVTTGNLLPVKGFDILIAAFSKLNFPAESWLLNIIGDGKEHDYLQNLIDRLQLSQNIHLLGRKNRDGVIEMLHKSDVYVMSSRSETFGVAAIEALACGLPVIATECGGTTDFMNKDNGITCPTNNVEKLAECINYMMEHCHGFNRMNISEDCQKYFSSNCIGKKLESIFEGLVNKKE